MSKLVITIPMTPPSVNHYAKHRVAVINGRNTVLTYPSKEAKVWWKAVECHASGKTLEAKDFEIAYVVYQGAGERGDVDNYAKCILDALVRSKVISTDHKVCALHAYKVRDRSNPRTEIFIRESGQLALLPEAPMPAKDEW